MPRSASAQRVTPIRRRKLDEKANMLRLCLIWTLPDKLNRGPRQLTNLSRELRSKCMVTRYGRICLGKKKINFTKVFAGQAVGIKEVHGDIWLASFMDCDLGYFDLETRVFEPLGRSPFRIDFVSSHCFDRARLSLK